MRVTGASDGAARLWEITSKRPRLLATLSGHQERLEGVAFSPGGGQILTGTSDGPVRLWEAASGRLLATLEGHQKMWSSVATPDGRCGDGSYIPISLEWSSPSGEEGRDVRSLFFKHAIANGDDDQRANSQWGSVRGVIPAFFLPRQAGSSAIFGNAHLDC